MSNLPPGINEEDLKGSVDFDFFSDETPRNGTHRSGPITPRPGTQEPGDAGARDELSRRSRSRSRSKSRSKSRSRSRSWSNSSRGSNTQRRAKESSRSRSRSKSRSQSRSRSRSPAKPRSRSRSSSKSRSRSRSRSNSPSRRRRSRDSTPERNISQQVPTFEHKRRSSSASSSASDVTDVSPLSSREHSPVGRPPKSASAPRNSGVAAGTGRNSRARSNFVSSTRSAPPAGNEERDEDKLNVETIVRALMQIDRRQQRAQSATGHRQQNRNLSSQSMSRMQEIDTENQRLLYSLMKTKQRKKTAAASIDPPVKRPHHSTVNRQREQRRIEEENRKIFQRLKQVRPTKGMTRDEMIRDYRKQASFGLPLSLQGREVKFRQPKITQNPYCQPLTRVHSSPRIVHKSRPSSASSANSQQQQQRQQKRLPVASSRAEWPSGW